MTSLSSVHVVSVLLHFTDCLVIFCKNSCYLRVLKPINKQLTMPKTSFDELLLRGHPLLSGLLNSINLLSESSSCVKFRKKTLDPLFMEYKLVHL